MTSENEVLAGLGASVVRAKPEIQPTNNPDKEHDEKLLKTYFAQMDAMPELLDYYLKKVKEKGYKSSLDFFRHEIGGLRYFNNPSKEFIARFPERACECHPAV